MAGAHSLPLAGITVVDLGGSVATAMCGKLFADFGARVVDVEPPGGHATRWMAPLVGDAGGDWSALHALLSPNKESVVAQDASERLRWLAGADVALHFGAPDPALGAMRQLPPGLVNVAISWFGLTGPYAGRAANDATLFSEIGLVKTIGEPTRPPVLPSGYLIQLLGGATAFVAAVAQLLGRELGSEQRSVELDVSLLEAAMCLTEVSPVAYFNGGQPLPRLGRNRFLPNYPAGIFATQDGWLGVTALTPKQWRDLCDLLGLPALGREPRYQVGLQRLFDADPLDALLAPVLRERTTAEWLFAGQARRIPLAPVPTMADLLASEQIEAREAFREITLESGRVLRVPGPPFRLSRTPAHRHGRLEALGASRVSPGTRRSALPATELPTRSSLRPPGSRPSLLRGIRVLDLTMGWAGPLATRHLADLGAEVIKVESRQRFDWWRHWEVTEAVLRERVYEKSAAYNTMNRNKLCVTIDLTVPRGVELFKRLVADADAVIENYSAGVMEKLGLGEAELSALSSRLVIVSMPPFGRSGPYQDFRAYGSTVEHASGLPHLNGADGDPPTMLHIALGDPVAGVHGAAALVLALLHQRRTGEGQCVDLSQVEALTGLGLHGLAHQAVLGEAPPRLGNRHPLHAPQGTYPCRGEDQWITLAVETDAQWLELRALVGAAALNDPALQSQEARRREHDRIDAALADWARRHDRDEAARALSERGIPSAPVYDVDEVLTHPQLEARGFWQWVERAVVGMQPVPSAPYRSGPLPHPIETPAPTLGCDTREVLRGLLAISDAELDELERERVIGTEPVAPPTP